MSELSNLMQFVKFQLKNHPLLDKKGAYALARIVMNDSQLSTTERLFLKALLQQDKVAPEAMPVIQDILEGRLKPAKDYTVEELANLVAEMGRVDRNQALQIKQMLLEDHVLSADERKFLDSLLYSNRITPEAEVVLRNLLYSQPE